MRYDPVIVLAVHRSGSTYLMRLLNACPDLVVWGEHGGFLGGIREALVPVFERLGTQPKLSVDLTLAKSKLQKNFMPFMNPFSGKDLQDGMMELLTSMFSRGLPPSTRWGFKEIRYPSRVMVEWFYSMWPEAQLIFNLRDPVELCSSSLRAEWVVERLKKGVGGYTKNKLPEVVFNTMAKIYSMERLALNTVKTYGDKRAAITWYEDMVEDPQLHSKILFKFLGHSNFDTEHIATTSKNIVGVAKKFSGEDPPELDPTNIIAVAHSLKDKARSLEPPNGIQLTPRWNFCVGIVGSDMFTYTPRNRG